MKTKQLFIVFILISLITLTACSPKSTVEKSTKEPIIIGATLALSGNLAYIGQQEAKGINLAIEEINSHGGANGHKFKAIIEDNEGDAQKAVTSVHKLINIDNSSVLLSAFTHITQAVQDIVASNNKIMFYQAVQSDIAAKNTYAFRDYFDIGEHGKFIGDLFKSNPNATISILTEVSPQCNEFISAFKNQTQPYNINILNTVEYESGSKDIRTHILKLEPAKVDALVACLWRDNDIFMQELKSLDLINKPSYQTVAPFFPRNDTPELRRLYEENKTISTWFGFTKDSQDSKYLEFKNKFITKHGEEPTADAVYFYDDMFILRDALEACDSRGLIKDNDCIAEELLKTDYDGAGGHLSFDENGVSSREVFAIQVKDGEWVEVK